ncbi:MAG: hypothetical protein HY696_13075 [Deltaproteobacteria bacterium]|nr:hypothetical protein [Deltaproteobacteria bacterium]
MSLINQVAAQLARAQASLPPDGPVADRFAESQTRAIIGREKAEKPATTETESGSFIEYVMQKYRAVLDGLPKTTSRAASADAPKSAPVYREYRGFQRK